MSFEAIVPVIVLAAIAGLMILIFILRGGKGGG